MKLDLCDYVKVYQHSISDNDCMKVIQQLSDSKWQDNYFHDVYNDKKISVSGDNEVSMSFDTIESSDILMNIVWMTIRQYISDLEFPWFTGWNGYSRIRFNKYTENKEMSQHYDCIHSLFDGNVRGIPTLSIVGLLNDDFDGGDLIMFSDKKISLKRGDILVFPSTFLYPHMIKKVTKGTRYSFVSWVW